MTHDAQLYLDKLTELFGEEDAIHKIEPLADGGKPIFIFFMKTSQTQVAGDAKYGYKIEHNSIILLKLNKHGNLVWNSLISGRYYDSLNSISILNDKGIFISANTTSLGGGEANGWLIKVNDKGKIIEDSTTN